MTSKSPSQSFKDIESDADALMDELFRDVEESFSAQAALPEPDGESVNRKPTQRSRSRTIPWGAVALGGLAAFSGTVLWWSYVHLPKRLAILSGQSTDNSSLVAASDLGDAEGQGRSASATGDEAASNALSVASAADESANSISDAVEVVEGAVETTAAAATDVVTANPMNADPAIADIEVDQAEVDRILAATAPPPIPAPPPAPVAYAPPPPPPAPPPAPDMTLVGVMDGSNGDAVALLMVGNVMRQVAVGEAITGGWRVASISDRSVSVTNGAQSEVLGL